MKKFKMKIGTLTLIGMFGISVLLSASCMVLDELFYEMLSSPVEEVELTESAVSNTIEQENNFPVINVQISEE